MDYSSVLFELMAQEEELCFKAFNHQTAWDLGSQMVKSAMAERNAITIDITLAGQKLFHYAMPGTTPDNDMWIERKSRVVQQFHHSSLFMRYTYESDETTLEKRSLLDEKQYAAHGGAFPLTIEGTGVVGTITVSGLPQVEDHLFVVTQLRRFLSSNEPTLSV